MSKMMKQMGIDMDEINADKVEVKIGDKKLVFDNPDLSKINAQGNEVFQLQGDYREVEEKSFSDEDVELVMEKTGASKKDAEEALKDNEEVAEAILALE